MDEDVPCFCSACGAPLDDSDSFCTRCGKYRNTGTCYTGCQTQHNNFGVAELKSNILVIIAILSALWTIFALAIGVYLIGNADYLTTLLDQNELDLIGSLGLSYIAVFTLFGALIFVSGVFAFITAALCMLKRFYTIALAACLISALFGLFAIVGFIGFIIAFFIHRSKNEFKNTKKNVL